MILPRSFYARDTVTVAQELLGKYLVHESSDGLVSGKIVETEAYLGRTDLAAHAFHGLTSRTTALFAQTGTIYIYLIYGLHYCFNIVSNQKGLGEAVLIRALEPVNGIEVMKRNRGIDKIEQLCKGPANLVKALGISFSHNGLDATRSSLCVVDYLEGFPKNEIKKEEIVTVPRVGITKAADLPLRFYLNHSLCVSKK